MLKTILLPWLFSALLFVSSYGTWRLVSNVLDKRLKKKEEEWLRIARFRKDKMSPLEEERAAVELTQIAQSMEQDRRKEIFQRKIRKIGLYIDVAVVLLSLVAYIIYGDTLFPQAAKVYAVSVLLIPLIAFSILSSNATKGS